MFCFLLISFNFTRQLITCISVIIISSANLDFLNRDLSLYSTLEDLVEGMLSEMIFINASVDNMALTILEKYLNSVTDIPLFTIHHQFKQLVISFWETSFKLG